MNAELIQAAVPGSIVWLVLAGVSLVLGSVLTTVLSLSGRRVPAVASAAVPLLPLVAMVGGQALADGSILGLMSPSLAVFAFMLIGAPVWVLVFAAHALVALRTGPRRLPVAGGIAALGALTGVVAIAGGVVVSDVVLFTARAGLYGLCGILVGLACGAGQPADGETAPGGRAAGAVAGVAFAAMVALGELAADGLARCLMLTIGSETKAENHALFIDRALAEVAGRGLWGWGLVAMACVVGIAAIATSGDGRRSALNWAATGYIALIPLLYWLGGVGRDALVAALQAG